MGISFEEFIGRLETVQKDFSDDVEIVLNRGANRMVRALKTNSPDSGNDPKDISPSILKNTSNQYSELCSIICADLSEINLFAKSVMNLIVDTSCAFNKILMRVRRV